MSISRLSPHELLIMRLLLEKPRGLYGLEIVDQSGGQVKRGSVYVLLDRLEDKGFVKSRRSNPPKSQGGLPRPVYSPTGEGSRVVAAYDAFEARLDGAVT